MPKTSCQRLFSAFLSASLLLATAGSADAEGTATVTGPRTAAVIEPRASAVSTPATAPVIGSPLNNSSKNPSLAYSQAKTLQGSVSSATLSSAAHGYAASNFAMRTPLLLLDDLTESALHIKQSLIQASGQTAERSSGTLQNLSKSARTFVPNYFDYRPSRAAAQAFLAGDAPFGNPRANPIDSTNANSNANLIASPSANPYSNQASAYAAPEQAEDERTQRNKLALTLTATMMQIAKGLGDGNTKGAEQSIERGRNKLTQLLGRGQADWVLTRMKSWAEQITANPAAINVGESDLLEQEEQISALVSRAINRDQQVSNLKASIAIHDKAPTGAERSLSLAGLTPNLVGPAAKLAQYAVERGTGGTRSKRLEDVLTLGMAMQERINLLTRESELAINNLERAKSAKNSVLYAFSKDLIAKLGGP
jgi:hypothetical protein